MKGFMQTMLCIMYPQHLYEMQALSFLLACNLLAIFQAEQGEQSKEDTWATATPTIPYTGKTHRLLHPEKTSNAKKCWICQNWVRQLSGRETHHQVACVNEEEAVFFSSYPEATQASSKQRI